ncbi:MAG: ATP-binding protein, partial [Desulfovibrionaceae bacterium]|nr:ATP-binding protein [Desulfovibrionaceae bacterium]
TDVTLNELNLRIPPPEKLLYLQKPFRPQELRQLALSLCSKWDAECRLRELNQTLAQKVEARTRDLDQANRKLRLDIDRRIKVLQDLRASEEKYRLLFEEDVAGNFVADARGRILSCNNAFARMFGFPGQEEAKALEVFGPRLESPPGAAVLEMVKARGRIENLETSFGRGRDKVLALCSCEAASADDGRGVEEIRGYFFDITERKRLEEQLRLAQKMEALGTLAGGIAHDFNNILGVIMGYAEIIREGADKGTGLGRRVDEIIRAGNRARDLVNQILNFSRQGPQERRSLKAAPLIKEALKLLRASLPVDIEIETRITAKDDGITADPTQVHQILLNLCANAAHAMKGSGGRLGVTLADVGEQDEVQPPAELGQGRWYLRLTISDTGHGMDQEVLDRIFDPFFSTKKPGEGTGMGLAVVHGIVKSHGGAVTVRSEPGKGSEFHVFLPKAAGLKRPALPPRPVLVPSQGKVLFVDDEKPLVDIGQEMLTGFGFEVVARTSSVEALEAFRFRPDDFDLVVTDQYMPNMTGLELAQEILKIRPDIPIILCTGFSEAASYERIRSMGVSDFVMKPILKHELIESIARLLNPDQDRSGERRPGGPTGPGPGSS